MIKIINYFNNM